VENSSGGVKAVVVVQSRMGSQRFPGKMMADLAGRPLLWHILQRAGRVGSGLPVVLATTTRPRDDALVTVAAALDVAVVRGSEDDVLGRFILALDRFPADYVVRVCGDSPLFAPAFLGACLTAIAAAEADVVRLSPDGPSLLQGGEVISARALRWTHRTAGDDPRAREHVTAYALARAAAGDPALKTALVTVEPQWYSDLKLSVDTPADLDRMRALYKALWNAETPVDFQAAVAWLAGPGAAVWHD